MSLNSNSKCLFFYYVDFLNEKIQKDYSLKHVNEGILSKDNIIRNYYSTENYLMLQYEREIEIFSFSEYLKIF